MQKTFSIIIPHRYGEFIDSTLFAIYLCDYDKKYIEIFQAEGTHPSLQRNACIKQASGEIIYFLDNDSIVDANNLKIASEVFASDDKIAIVGGPAKHITNTNIEKYIDVCLSSFFAVGPLSNRYTKKTNKIREGTDRDVILCNLFIRRDVINEAGLFDENLYPNEENALIDKILAKDYKLIYHPDITVKRPPRENLKSYIKMLLNYGRGRIEQTIRDFNIKNIIFIMPSFFTFYIISIPFVMFFLENINYKHIYLLPFGIYFILNALLGFITAMKTNHKLKGIFIYPFMFFTTHFFYGLGFFYGVIKILFGKKKIAKFNIKKYKDFD